VAVWGWFVPKRGLEVCSTTSGAETHLDVGIVVAVAFSPDGDRMAIATDDGRVEIWKQANQTSSVLEVGRVRDLEFADAGRLAIFGESDAVIWDLATGSTHRLANAGLGGRRSPDGARLVSLGYPPSDPWLWDTSTWQGRPLRLSPRNLQFLNPTTLIGVRYNQGVYRLHDDLPEDAEALQHWLAGGTAARIGPDGQLVVEP
jgi:WD40 repeat protein